MKSALNGHKYEIARYLDDKTNFVHSKIVSFDKQVVYHADKSDKTDNKNDKNDKNDNYDYYRFANLKKYDGIKSEDIFEG